MAKAKAVELPSTPRSELEAFYRKLASNVPPTTSNVQTRNKVDRNGYALPGSGYETRLTLTWVIE